MGDFNICFLTERQHPIFQRIELEGFEKLLKEPTHAEGRQIDLVFHYSLQDKFHTWDPTVHQFGQYFTDHDLIQISLNQVNQNYLYLNLFNFFVAQ